ncbi:hypothetical protein J1605_004597 [Eschrichtius robustus]|uniref:Uncharacterized protein n=1 Tax=Eschrichtius robustus TaxID=9764 RepID=A0AB34HJ90_ESCRO|nr:hypothetical protein J1605_004597 [Eschrichtius robustus]
MVKTLLEEAWAPALLMGPRPDPSRVSTRRPSARGRRARRSLTPPRDARAFLKFNYKTAVRHHVCERAFGVKGQQSGTGGSLSVFLAAAAQANTPTREDLLVPFAPSPHSSPPARPASLPFLHPLPSAPCPSHPALRHARKATPLAQPRRVSTAPPAPCPRRIGLRTRNPLASREPGRKGTHCSRENVHGLHFPTGRASRCPRRPGEPPWTTFPDRPRETVAGGRGLRFPSGRAGRRQRLPGEGPRTPLPGAPREAPGPPAEGGPTRAART